MYTQGVFKPAHPEKCVNCQVGKPPFARSSYEMRFFNWCDMNENVVKWASELIEIPYINGIDNKQHRYYPDVYIEVKTHDGKIEKFLVEIKPKSKLSPPKEPKRKTRKSTETYKTLVAEYVMNRCKWDAALRYSKMRDINFRLITEDHIFGDKGNKNII